MTFDTGSISGFQAIFCVFGAVMTMLLSIIGFGVRTVLKRLDEMVTRAEWAIHNKALADERESLRKDVEHNRERTETLEDRMGDMFQREHR